MFEQFKVEVEKARQWQEFIKASNLALYHKLLIEEGIDELAEGHRERDFIKQRDALADCVVVSTGCLETLGYKYERTNGIAQRLLGSPKEPNFLHVFESVSACLYNPTNLNHEDLISVCYVVASYCGFNLAADLKEVNRSNYSKFCDCLATLKATQEKYRNMGINTRYERLANGQYAVFADGDNGKIPDGKLMKGISYSEPDLMAVQS